MLSHYRHFMQLLNWTSKVGEALALSVPDDFDLAADMRAFMDVVRTTTVSIDRCSTLALVDASYTRSLKERFALDKTTQR